MGLEESGDVCSPSTLFQQRRQFQTVSTRAVLTTVSTRVEVMIREA